MTYTILFKTDISFIYILTVKASLLYSHAVFWARGISGKAVAIADETQAIDSK